MTVIAAGMEIPRDSLRDKEALHTMTEDSGPGLDDDGECVLVVSKIESFRTGTQELILFSAVGLVDFPSLSETGFLAWLITCQIVGTVLYGVSLRSRSQQIDHTLR